jgi:hypothetical protein
MHFNTKTVYNCPFYFVYYSNLICKLQFMISYNVNSSNHDLCYLISVKMSSVTSHHWAPYLYLEREPVEKGDAKMAQIDAKCQSLSFILSARSTRMCNDVPRYRAFTTNERLLWFWITWSAIRPVRKKLDVVGENGVETVYDVHRFGRQFPPYWLHFSHRPNDWSTPDIYRAHCLFNRNPLSDFKMTSIP